MEKCFDELKKEITSAVGKYGEDHIDVVLDDGSVVYGIYHSRNNSFPVTEKYPKRFVETESVRAYANRIGIGIVG